MQRHAKVLELLLEYSQHVQHNFVFIANDLVIPGSDIFTLEKVQKYLSLFARTTQQLRDIL